ncbi:MAG: hypothetical protein PQJ47_08545 [Sphaerochaetaceae bacterium]|nr:hypothetical protein [Sphaerochaetaceae bacterium]
MKKILITLMIVVVLLGAALFLLVHFGEQKIMEMANELPGVAVSSVAIDLFSQDITMTDTAYTDGDTFFTATSVKVHLLAQELFDLLFLPSRELYEIDLEAENLNYGTVGNRLQIQYSALILNGIFPLEDIESSVIQKADADLTDFRILQDDNIIASFSSEKVTIRVTGHFDRDTKFDKFDELIMRADSLSLECETPHLILSEDSNEIPQWIPIQDDLKGTILSFSTYREDEIVHAPSFELDLPILSISGKFDVSLFSPLWYEASVDVNALDETIRRQLSLPLMFLGYYIPEGPFTVDAQQIIGEGPPEFIITEK